MICVTSGTGERLDDEAKRDYEAELIELREDIAEAESFNDPGRLEQLRSEFQKIADELSKSKGKDGQSRITTDAGKSRRNVRQQMQRDINKKIAPQHPELADHLLKAFKRSWMCYQSARKAASEEGCQRVAKKIDDVIALALTIPTITTTR